MNTNQYRVFMPDPVTSKPVYLREISPFAFHFSFKPEEGKRFTARESNKLVKDNKRFAREIIPTT